MNKYAVRTITCKGCGKTVTGRLRPNQEYCSLSCYRRSERPQRKTGKEVTCELCGKAFYSTKQRLEIASHYFCCIEHANEWQGRNKTEHTCKICGKAFRWSPSRSKAYNITYCSIECRDKDPERSAMLLRMNVAQQKISPNKLEQAGFAILDGIGVEYVKQYTVGGKFAVDAFVPSANLAVQFDGEYWHGHPSKYNAQDKRQQRRIRLDHSQDAYMHQCGIRVIRFWESDVPHSPDHVKQSLAAAIRP